MKRKREKHGLTGTKAHSRWRAMINRCYNPKNNRYYRYGARGIKVCDRWRYSLLSFVEDMGFPPEGMTIDRIDPNGNYELSNCKWSTSIEQAVNRDVKSTNTSGVTGVSYHKKHGRWICSITVNKKRIHLSSSKNKTDCIVSRLKAEIEYFGELKQKHLAHYLDDSKK